jgi:hypothetical protein
LYSNGSAALNEVNVQLNQANLGSALYNSNSLDVTNSAIHSNTGDAVVSNGTLTMLNVTISGNIPGTDPGNAGLGLGVLGGAANLRYVTITANGASTHSGGGISASGGVSLHNSIVHGNGINPQCSSPSGVIGAFSDGGYNVLADNSCSYVSTSGSIIADPKLGAISYNGGFFALTHALQPGSPAIDLVPQDKCTPKDQRGVARPIDGNGDGKLACDAGAYEFEP